MAHSPPNEALLGPRDRRRAAIIAGGLLVAITVAAYAPAIATAGFVWDDDQYVVDNRTLRSVDGLVRIWTDASATPQYYPLTHTSFWIEYRLFGLDPRGYRTGNVLLHAMACVLLWRVLRRIGIPGAWLAAALFAVHPLHVESVAWITERKNVLCGVLYLASLALWLRAFDVGPRAAPAAARDPAVERPFPIAVAAAAFTCFGLALFAKTVAATLPVTLLAILLLRKRRVELRAAVYAGGMLAAGAICGALTAALERHQIGTIGPEWAHGFVERLGLAGRAWWFYLGKLAFPHDLTFIYPRPDPTDGVGFGIALAVGAAATLAVALALRGRLRAAPFVAVGIVHYTATLGPALGFVDIYPQRYAFVADHFAYLASIAPLAGAAAVVAWIGTRAGRIVSASITVALVVGGAIAVVVHSPPYRSYDALWRHTLDRNPGAWIAHNNLGILDAEAGRAREAERHFREAIALGIPDASAGNNLGVLLLSEDRVDEARRVLERAADVDPADANTRLHLGEAYERSGDGVRAAAAYREAAALRPGDDEPLRRWAAAAGAAGRLRDALRPLRALARPPFTGDETVFERTAAAAIALGDRATAIDATERLLAMRDEPTTRFRLAILLAESGAVDRARDELRAVVRAAPGFEPAREALRRLGGP